MSTAHGGFFIGCLDWFELFGQSFNDLGRGSSAQSFLLGAAPPGGRAEQRGAAAPRYLMFL